MVKEKEILGIKKKLNRVEREVERPGFYRKRKLFLKSAKQKFESYSKGVKRLKELEQELNLLDTRKFKRQEEAIRKKLRDVSLIPVIEQDLKELKLRIAGFDVESAKALVDKTQERKIRRISSEEHETERSLLGVNRRIGRVENESQAEILRLRKKIHEANGELERVERLARKKQLSKDDREDLENLPLLKRRLSILSKEQKRIIDSVGKIPTLETIENKVDEKSLEFYDRLTRELAESRRRMEEEKFELRKQLLETLAESLRQLNKEKEESDKKILGEIEKVKSKIDEEKHDINQNIISKIVQLRSKIEDSKSELQKDTEKQIALLEKKLSGENLGVKQKEIPKKPEPFKPILIGRPVASAKIAVPAKPVARAEEKKLSEARLSIASPFFPEMPKLPELPPKKKILKSIEISPANLKKAVLAAEKEVEKKHEKAIVKIPKGKLHLERKQIVPGKKFFEYPKFEVLRNSLGEIENIVSLQKKQVLRSVEDEKESREIEKCMQNTEHVLESIKNVSAELFSKSK